VSKVLRQWRRIVGSRRARGCAGRTQRDRDVRGPRGAFVRRFLNDRDGAIAAISAVSLVVILGMGAFAIDMSYAYSERNLLQVTASAAALAAAPELPDQSKMIAKALEYAEANMPAAKHGVVVDGSDVVRGNWSPANKTWTPGATPYNAVQITTRRSSANGNQLDLFLAPILGLGSLDMEASAVVYFRAPTAWDVALVQDVTGTFAEEIGDARVADQVMLDCVSNNFVDARMGLTAFTATSDVMMPMQPVGLPEHLSNYVAMSDAIDLLDSCGNFAMPPCSGTHVGIGIEAAIDQLDSYVPEQGIIGQAIVIVSDGRPQALPHAQPFYPESDYYSVCNGDCSNSDLAQMAVLAADEADSKGYDVYVVFYDEENDDTAAQFLESLVRGAGQFRRTPNSNELEDMMFQLCTNFTELKLVM
jgi:Flp pilus assembly protein TadG